MSAPAADTAARTGRVALALSILLAAWYAWMSGIGNKLVDEPLPLVRGQSLSRSFTASLSSRYVIVVELGKSPGLDVAGFLGWRRTGGQGIPIAWQVYDEAGAMVAGGNSSHVGGASYAAARAVGRRIGEFDAEFRRRYRIELQVLESVQAPETADTRLIVQLQRANLPGASPLLAWLWWSGMLAFYAGLPLASAAWILYVRALIGRRRHGHRR